MLLAGELVMGCTVALPEVWPGWAIVGWAVAGIGMGVAFNAATSATMAVTTVNSVGSVSGSLQLAQTLATAIIAGVGGAIVARLGVTTPALIAVFGLCAVLGVLGTLLARRLGDVQREARNP